MNQKLQKKVYILNFRPPHCCFKVLRQCGDDTDPRSRKNVEVAIQNLMTFLKEAKVVWFSLSFLK